jgi:hypothetical protein
MASFPAAPPTSARPDAFALELPLGLNRIAERTHHDVAPVRPAQRSQRSFAAIGNGPLNTRATGGLHTASNRRRRLSSRQGATELVYCCKNPEPRHDRSS